MRKEIGKTPKPKEYVRTSVSVPNMRRDLWMRFGAMNKMRGMSNCESLEELITAYLDRYGKLSFNID